MKNKLTLFAIALWLCGAVILAILFVRGSTAPAEDGRTAVLLQPGERDFVLAEMRSMLMRVRSITEGLAENRRADIIQAAREGGSAAVRGESLALMAKLPLDFKQLGMAMHRGFDELAAATERGEATDKLLGRLTAELDRCVACHQSYRIDAPTRQ